MTKAAFIIITLLSLLFLYWATGRDKRRLSGFILWQFLVGILTFLGVFVKHPNLFLAIILGTIVSVSVMVKRIDTRELSTGFLLAIHTLRIPVELVLYQLFLQRKLPILMTFKGWNFDIAVGISALLILIYFLINKRVFKKGLFIIWNIIGTIFLFIIVPLGVLSSPLPIQQFAFDQPNIAVLEFPYSFLPSCVVPIVLVSHIMLIRMSKSVQK